MRKQRSREYGPKGQPKVIFEILPKGYESLENISITEFLQAVEKFKDGSHVNDKLGIIFPII